MTSYDETVLGEAAPAIFQTSLFGFDSVEEFERAVASGKPYYTRGRNPTVLRFEEEVRRLEKAEAALAFASGMAAIAAALLALLRPGDRVVASTPIYAGTHNLLTGPLARWGVHTTWIPAEDTEGLIRALPGARLLYLESPASYTYEVVDLEPLTRAARDQGIPVLMDATYTAGVLAQPLAQGADLVLHSASKYFSGHSDVVAGVAAGRSDLVAALRETYMLLGAKLAPFEAWLLLRGMRTLKLRLAQHARTARKAASLLKAHPAVRRVHWVEDHPRAKRYLRHGASLISVELADEASARRFVNALRLFKVGVSWGGHESLALPLFAQPRIAQAYGFARGLVRLHFGLEPTKDLVADLEQALSRVS